MLFIHNNSTRERTVKKKSILRCRSHARDLYVAQVIREIGATNLRSLIAFVGPITLIFERLGLVRATLDVQHNKQ